MSIFDLDKLLKMLHCEAAVAPSAAVVSPELHGIHSLGPVSTLYVPIWQMVHESPP